MSVSYSERDYLVRDIKTIGQTIIDRAEDIVGEWDCATEYTIKGSVSIDSCPTVSWEKTIRALPTNAKKGEDA